MRLCAASMLLQAPGSPLYGRHGMLVSLQQHGGSTGMHMYSGIQLMTACLGLQDAVALSWIDFADRTLQHFQTRALSLRASLCSSSVSASHVCCALRLCLQVTAGEAAAEAAAPAGTAKGQHHQSSHLPSAHAAMAGRRRPAQQQLWRSQQLGRA